jgi:hypothetical protein
MTQGTRSAHSSSRLSVPRTRGGPPSCPHIYGPPSFPQPPSHQPTLCTHAITRCAHPLPPYHPRRIPSPPCPSPTRLSLLPWPLSGSRQTCASSHALPWLLLVVEELLVVVASAAEHGEGKKDDDGARSIPLVISYSAPPFRPGWPPARRWTPSWSSCCACGWGAVGV